MDDMSWEVEAYCRQLSIPTSIFYCDEDDDKGITAAKFFCKRCEVQDECLNWAIKNDKEEGIWGGLTQTERRSLRVTRYVQESNARSERQNKLREQQRLECASLSSPFDISDLTIHIQLALSKQVEVKTAFVITLPEFVMPQSLSEQPSDPD
jgi:WhiB family redox-sensing transcriptional regulator